MFKFNEMLVTSVLEMIRLWYMYAYKYFERYTSWFYSYSPWKWFHLQETWSFKNVISLYLWSINWLLIIDQSHKSAHCLRLWDRKCNGYEKRQGNSFPNNVDNIKSLVKTSKGSVRDRRDIRQPFWNGWEWGKGMYFLLIQFSEPQSNERVCKLGPN